VAESQFAGAQHGPGDHAHLWHKKQLRVGAARWICSGYPPEGSAWLGHYNRMLLTPARCAELPPAARGSGRPGRGERAEARHNAPLVGSDDAEGRGAAGRRCCDFAQSCGRRRSFDRGRPDLCSLHQQGSYGRFCCVFVRDDAFCRLDVGLAQTSENSDPSILILMIIMVQILRY
jgi:hypothetical protein